MFSEVPEGRANHTTRGESASKNEYKIKAKSIISGSSSNALIALPSFNGIHGERSGVIPSNPSSTELHLVVSNEYRCSNALTSQEDVQM